MQLGEERLGVGEQLAVPGVAGPAAAVDLRDVRRRGASPCRSRRPRTADPRRRSGRAGPGTRRRCRGGSGSTSCPAPSGAAPAAGRTGRRRPGPPRRSRGRRRRRRGRGSSPVRGGDPAVVGEDHRGRVVERRRNRGGTPRPAPAAAGRRRCPGSGRCRRRSGHRLAVPPHRVVGRGVAADLQRQPGRGERAAVVGQVEAVGDDLQRPVGLGDRERRDGQVSMPGQRRGAVLEGAGGRPLQADEAGGQNGDPVPVPDDHRGGVRYRRRDGGAGGPEVVALGRCGHGGPFSGGAAGGRPRGTRTAGRRFAIGAARPESTGPRCGPRSLTGRRRYPARFGAELRGSGPSEGVGRSVRRVRPTHPAPGGQPTCWVRPVVTGCQAR